MIAYTYSSSSNYIYIYISLNYIDIFYLHILVYVFFQLAHLSYGIRWGLVDETPLVISVRLWGIFRFVYIAQVM